MDILVAFHFVFQAAQELGYKHSLRFSLAALHFMIMQPY